MDAPYKEFVGSRKGNNKMTLKNSIAIWIRRNLETEELTPREKSIVDSLKRQEKSPKRQERLAAELRKVRKSTVHLENIIRKNNYELKRLARGSRINGNSLAKFLISSVSNKEDIPFSLNNFEAQIYSQNGEDGILLALFNYIGVTNKTFVEIGAGGLENNTNNLFFNNGWRGLWIDLDAAGMERLSVYLARNFPDRADDVTICVEKVSCENINSLIGANCRESEPDLLTIDVDGNDAHLLRALSVVRPRVLMVEYNASFGLEPVTIPYDPNFVRGEIHSFYYGASLTALTYIAEAKGYRLVCCETEGVNAIFVRADALQDKLAPIAPDIAFMPQRRRTQRYAAGQQWAVVKDMPLERVADPESADASPASVAAFEQKAELDKIADSGPEIEAVEFVHVKDAIIHVSPDDTGGVSAFLRQDGSYEEALHSFYAHAISPGDTVLDVGANIGYFSVFFSRWVEGKGRVFAFEPDERNIEYLRKNLDANQCTNVEIVESAVSDRKGQVKFYRDANFWGVHSLNKDNVQNQSQEVIVEATTLDTFVQDRIGSGSIPSLVIKMDTQGAEPLILAGGAETFKEHCKLLTLEYWPEGVRSFGKNARDLLEDLYDLGFSIAPVPKKSVLKTLDLADLSARLDRKSFGKWNSLNLIGVKLPPKIRISYEDLRQHLAGSDA